MNQPMTPQERAAALIWRLFGIVEMQPYQRAARIEWILEHDKETRRAALLECRDYALACVKERQTQAFELAKVVINDPRAVWLGCKASEAERIAEWIDRLAQEG